MIRKEIGSPEDMAVFIRSLGKIVNVYEFTGGFIGDSIIDAQNLYWKEQKPPKESKYSHIVLYGNDDKIYESTVSTNIVTEEKKFLFWKIKVPVLKTLVYGIKITKLSEYCKSVWHCDRLLVQELPTIEPGKWDEITKKAIEESKKGVKYGGLELFGTLWVLLQYKITRDVKKRAELLAKKNPLDSKDAMYCIAFVETCFESCGVELVKGIDTSVLTVDHGLMTSMKNTQYQIEKA